MPKLFSKDTIATLEKSVEKNPSFALSDRDLDQIRRETRDPEIRQELDRLSLKWEEYTGTDRLLDKWETRALSGTVKDDLAAATELKQKFNSFLAQPINSAAMTSHFEQLKSLPKTEIYPGIFVLDGPAGDHVRLQALNFLADNKLVRERLEKIGKQSPILLISDSEVSEGFIGRSVRNAENQRILGSVLAINPRGLDMHTLDNQFRTLISNHEYGHYIAPFRSQQMALMGLSGLNVSNLSFLKTNDRALIASEKRSIYYDSAEKVWETLCNGCDNGAVIYAETPRLGNQKIDDIKKVKDDLNRQLKEMGMVDFKDGRVEFVMNRDLHIVPVWHKE